MLGGLFQKIRDGLAKTRQVFSGIARLFRLGDRVDEALLERLEATLIQADVGLHAATAIVDGVRQAYLNKEVTEDLLGFVKAQLKQLMTAPAGLNFAASGPTVILVAGINGSGKTTSIAKLAYRFKEEGKSVLLAAGDTFRAAAVNQLSIWSERIGCEIVKAPQSATGGKVDPASVAHDACERAKSRGINVVVVDTAGRLHTQQNLMAELEKIRRVVSKQIEGAPHEVLLVLDASTGQNAVQQARLFTQCVQCTGIILAKLDGTAKGGAVVVIKRELSLPVKFVGVGEKLPDLEVFDPDAFVDGLFG
ncbi:MAG: signal recognition particle-docking protein FtsY [Planctomycetes bacterium]|nr:signal recognition particle-docking protein FtsY [Planctomycetota bacterium]